MRFALPEGVTEEQVQHAQLQMQIRAAAIFNYRLPLPVSGTLTLAIGEVLDTWDEATLSSAAPPRIATHILRVDREWHPCHGDECGSAIADVTPFVRSWLAGTTANNGLVLHVGGALDEPVMGTVFDIASRESDDPPIIRLTTTGDKPSTALRLWMPLALRYLPRPATAEPSPGPSATPTPKPTPAVGRYLLVERWEDRERGPGCTPLLIDFPTYRFDPVSGELHLWPRYGWNPALEPSDVGYFASGARVSGRGGGEASGLSRMVELPFDARDIRVASVDRDGAIVATHEGVTLDLVAGGAHRWQSVSPGDGPSCVITMTGRLTNYGYQDRSKIVYDE